jgi:hypothetical protein
MSARIPVNSRLNMADLLSEAGIEFWETVVLPPIPTSEDDIEHEVHAGDRLDVLAQRYYGDPVLWWYIAVANDIELIPIELTNGSKLRIPPMDYLSLYMGSQRF